MINERPQTPIESPEVRRDTPQTHPSNSQRRLAAVALGGALVIALVASVVILGAASKGSPAAPGSTSTIGYTSRQSTSTTTTTTTTTSTSAAPSPPAPPALAAVSTYWDAVGRHDFAAAYAILAPGAVPQSEAQWVATEQSTGVERIRFQGEVGDASDTHATITVVSLVTVDQQFGCRSWTGTYELTNQGGRWLIRRADIAPVKCPAGPA